VKENGVEDSSGGNRELLHRNLNCKYWPVGTFVEFQMCVLRDEIWSAHDVARYLM
jgi:hypothetical protein